MLSLNKYLSAVSASKPAERSRRKTRGKLVFLPPREGDGEGRKLTFLAPWLPRLPFLCRIITEPPPPHFPPHNSTASISVAFAAPNISVFPSRGREALVPHPISIWQEFKPGRGMMGSCSPVPMEACGEGEVVLLFSFSAAL